MTFTVGDRVSSTGYIYRGNKGVVTGVEGNNISVKWDGFVHDRVVWPRDLCLIYMPESEFSLEEINAYSS